MYAALRVASHVDYRLVPIYMYQEIKLRITEEMGSYFFGSYVYMLYSRLCWTVQTQHQRSPRQSSYNKHDKLPCTQRRTVHFSEAPYLQQATAGRNKISRYDTGI